MRTTCGIFVINKIDKTVLLCHYRGMSYLTWRIPHSICEDHQQFKDMALKILKEDTGLELNKNDVIELPFCNYVKDPNFRLKPFIFITPTSFSVSSLKSTSLDRFDVDLYSWMPFPLAKVLLMPSYQSDALDYYLQNIAENDHAGCNI